MSKKPSVCTIKRYMAHRMAPMRSIPNLKASFCSMLHANHFEWYLVMQLD